MKTGKLIAGLLVILGFTACKPDKEAYEGPVPMYGPPPPASACESKTSVPDADGTAGVPGSMSTGKNEINENE